MNNSEKQAEVKLDNYLHHNKFDFGKIYYSPNEHDDLKYMFSKCSKTGKSFGIPDRIYYDNNLKLLIIFECKKDDIKLAINDAKYYCNNMLLDNIEIIDLYCVGFISDSLYKIYKTSHIEYKNCKFIIYKKSLYSIIQSKNINNINITNEIKKIHNYIYNHTKISNEDKSLFMAIILIGLKNDMFSNLICSNSESKLNLYPILESILSTNGILSNIMDMFKHLKHNQSNEEHVYNIITMVKNIYDRSPSIDLLNQFYSEFIKYGSTDSKTLGIVLTPPHIVELMTKILNISNNDIVLDLCAGTGSFLLESLKYNPLKIIGCEYQFKLFSLLKCNLIIRNINESNNNTTIDTTTYDIYNSDCFELNYKATKSIINPPYGSAGMSEWDFILKQLDSLEINGEAIAIVPNSIIFDSKSNRIYKQKLLNQAIVKNIILCRSSLFYPVANVSTIIIHFKKIDNTINNSISQNIKTNILDYRDDGFSSERTKGFIKNESFENKQNEILDIILNNATHNNDSSILNQIYLEYDSSWYILKKKENQNIIDVNQYKSSKLQIDYLEKLLELQNEFQDIKLDDNATNNIEFKIFTINDLFKILSKPELEYDKELINKKYVFQCAAKNNNNGIKDIVLATKNTFTKNKIILIVGGDGGSGLAYYISKDFIISSSVKVLSPLEDKIKLNKNIGLYIANQLSENKKIYNRGYTWKNDLILSSTFKLPIKNTATGSEIDYDFIDSIS